MKSTNATSAQFAADADVPMDLTRTLSDMDAARIVVAASPDLIAARAKVGVADAQLFSSGLIADPQLSLGLDHPTTPNLVDALTAGVGLDLMSLFNRGARVRRAHLQRDQTRLEVGWNEWLAVNHVRTLVRRIFALEKQVLVATQSSDAAHTLYALTERNMRVGDARLDDASIYQVGLIDAQDRALALERQVAAARQELDAMLGLPPDTALKLDAPALQPLDALDAQALALRAVDRRLDILALRNGYAAEEAGLRLAVRESLPLPLLSFNRARDTSAVWTTGLGIALPLPLWNRNRGAISIATATRAQLSAEYIARLLQTRGDIAAEVADLRHIDAQRRALANQLPTLAASEQIVARAAQEGNVALTTYNTLRASLLDKKLTLLALEQAQSEGEVALETAVGGWLWETPQ
ncbi:MAG: TolC family protein [Dokdonella sp.]